MFSLAIRHLLSRKKQTLLVLMGVVFGAAAFIAISGLLLGFRYFLIDQLINNDAHIRVSVREEFLDAHSLDQAFFHDLLQKNHLSWILPPSGRKDSASIDYPSKWFRRLEKDPRVVSFSPQLMTQAIVTNGQSSATANVVGCNPVEQEKVTTISKFMLRGSLSAISEGGNRIVIGAGLLKKVGAQLDSTVIVSTGQSDRTPFRVVGIFQTGIRTLDDSTAYVALGDAQRINNSLSKITDIAIRLTDATMAPQLAKAWSQTTHEKVQSWDQINSNVFSVFAIQDFVRYMMTATILIVAGFGIYNILNMVVTQKKKEIAILRSMGFEANDILLLFLIQGIILGIVGGLIGLALGYVACYQMQFFELGETPMGAGTGYVQVSFETAIYRNGFVLAFFASVIASILPARMAGRLSPIQIIREGAD